MACSTLCPPKFEKRRREAPIYRSVVEVDRMVDCSNGRLLSVFKIKIRNGEIAYCLLKIQKPDVCRAPAMRERDLFIV